MAAADPKARTRAARIAVNVSWSLTENRTERTAACRRAAPQSLEYWLAWAKEQHPNASPEDRVKAAKNAYSAHMQRMAAKAVAARKAKREQQAQKKGRPAA